MKKKNKQTKHRSWPCGTATTCYASIPWGYWLVSCPNYSFDSAPCLWHWEKQKMAQGVGPLSPMWMKLLVFVWPCAGHCGHLWSELVDEYIAVFLKLLLFLPLSVPFQHIKILKIFHPKTPRFKSCLCFDIKK